MPTYEYRCRTCDVRFEVQQSFTENSLTLCPSAASEQSPPACAAPGEGEVRKVFSAPSITFKGDGFYKTDSRSGGSRGANGSAAKKAGDDDATGTAKSGDADSKPSDAGSKGKASGSDGDSKGERAAASTSSS